MNNLNIPNLTYIIQKNKFSFSSVNIKAIVFIPELCNIPEQQNADFLFGEQDIILKLAINMQAQ